MKLRNDETTPVTEISGQMLERRPLPLGKTAFKEWSDRIISGSIIDADVESQRFALANMLLHLGPQESHKEDAYFIHSLRKVAINQVAHNMANEIKAAIDAKLAAEKAAEIAAKEAETTTEEQALKLV